VERLSVVVTGAGEGIGAATLHRLVADGYCVVGVDVNKDLLAAHVAAFPDRVVGVTGDVADRAVHERALAAALAIAPLGAWVNNAAIDVPARADTFDEADLRRIIDVNLIGTALGCATAVGAFLDQRGGGAIVNVSSLQAIRAFPSAFSYEASKGGVDAITRQLAVEYGACGIRVNAVQPGAILTPMTNRSLAMASDREAEVRSYAELHALERIGEAEEVAAVIAFLVSQDASFVTAVCLPVDGGAAARSYRYPPDPSLPVDRDLPAQWTYRR
jgi:NAD(P)-dependent dehydrogenase (short-subunit alcohol dehydrogenase family)